MSASDMHLVRTLADAVRHNPERPAFVELPGHMVRPVVIFRDESASPERTGASEMASAIEVLMHGLADRAPGMIEMGMSQAIISAAILTTAPEDVLEDGIVAENTYQDPNPTGLPLVQGQQDGDPIPMPEESDDIDLD